MVAPNTIRKLLKQEPFVPLQFHLRDGSVLTVVESGRVFLPPEWTRLLVTDSDPPSFDFVPLSKVEKVTVGKPGKRVENKRKSKE